MKAKWLLLSALLAGGAFGAGVVTKQFAFGPTFQPTGATIEYDEQGRVVGVISWRQPSLDSLSGMHTLNHLDVGGLNLTDDDLPPLRTLPDLQIVRLSDNEITDAGLRHVRDLHQLKSLVLRGNADITDEGLAHLEHLPVLKKLDLRGTRVTTSGVQKLRQSAPFVDVFVDVFKFSGLGELQDLRGRAEMNDDYDIVALEFAGTKIRDADLRRLRQLPKLRMLHLGKTQIGDTGLAHLEGIISLEELWLSDTRVTDDGLPALAGLTNLKGLSLTRNAITDEGVLHLTVLTNLRKLHLGGTAVNDAALTHLSALPNLETVWLDGAAVTSFGVRRLTEALPKLEVLGVSATSQLSAADAAADTVDEIETHVEPG